jgi:hypothetical protein
VGLLDRDYVDRANVRRRGEQVGCYLAEGLRDLPGQVGVSGVVGVESVEYAVAGVADLERIPGDSALLSDCKRATRFEECGEVVSLAGLGV